MDFENGYIADLEEFFARFYDKTFQNHLNGSSKNEIKINFLEKLEIEKLRNCSKKFFKSFCEINNRTFNQKLKENITDNLIYRELKDKFSEIKNRILPEKLTKKTWNKIFTDFYKFNKLNVNLLLKKLIDNYVNIEKNSRCLEWVLSDKFIHDIKLYEIENKQKKMFAEMIANEDFINVKI